MLDSSLSLGDVESPRKELPQGRRDDHGDHDPNLRWDDFKAVKGEPYQVDLTLRKLGEPYARDTMFSVC